MAEKEEQHDDDVYSIGRAQRPTKPPPKWRTDPQSSDQRRKLVAYCDNLEDVVEYQQRTLSSLWLFVHAIRKGEKTAGDVSSFIASQPTVNYRYGGLQK